MGASPQHRKGRCVRRGIIPRVEGYLGRSATCGGARRRTRIRPESHIEETTMRTVQPSVVPNLRAVLAPTAALSAAAVLLAAAGLAAGAGAAERKRLITLDDLKALVDVTDPQIAPDGGWVAYTVTRVDAKRDTTDDDLYMTSWDGQKTVRLTASPANENTPRFSPDGRWLAFRSRRENKDSVAQIWIMSREGGEGQALTRLGGDVSDFVWSPDSRRMVLVAEDPEEKPDAAGAGDDADDDDDTAATGNLSEAAGGDDDEGAARTPKPIVIDRYQFKRD